MRKPDEVEHLAAAAGEGAGLVEGHDLHAGQRLQHLAALHQHAHPRRLGHRAAEYRLHRNGCMPRNTPQHKQSEKVHTETVLCKHAKHRGPTTSARL